MYVNESDRYKSAKKENCSKYKYLEVVLHKRGKVDQEIQSKMQECYKMSEWYSLNQSNRKNLKIENILKEICFTKKEK